MIHLILFPIQDLIELIGSQSTSNDTITSTDQPSKRIGNTSTPYLPQWDVKSLQLAGSDVDEITSNCQTHSQKQQASVALITCVLETCDPNTYADVKGQIE